MAWKRIHVFRQAVAILTSLFLLGAFVSIEAKKDDHSSTSTGTGTDNGAGRNIASKTEKKIHRPTKVISLAESINRSQKNAIDPERAKASREQWETALKEIKELVVDISEATPPSVGNTTKALFDEWKLLLDQPSNLEINTDTGAEVYDESPRVTDRSTGRSAINRKPKTTRFEGFASWERMLQDWADDVQEYLDKVEAENADYPMATYTKPTTTSKAETVGPKEQVPPEAELAVENIMNVESSVKNETRTNEIMANNQKVKNKRSKISLPVPAPVKDGEAVLPHTDISDKSKRIWIVTTAALPWMTGTAVNPLLRAAYMVEGRPEAGGSVTLMLPWLERSQDRESVYGDAHDFKTPEEQETYIRNWLSEKAKLPFASKRLKIEWYTSWQNKAENSLYSMGDITALIPAENVDIMILEEPEHLNWYRAPGEHWTDKFKHVVGIVHTNYFVYASDQPAAFIRAPGMRLLCSWMCRAHCHRLIKLSGTLGRFAPEKELVENVHGVRASFLETGQEIKSRLETGDGSKNDPIFGSDAEPKIYFIGKMLWSKGLLSMMELLKYAEESAGIKVEVDMYGGGPDKDAADERAQSLGVDLDFLGPIDHGELGLSHKIFINPSTSEVLTTTTAEALAMGKFVILPSHPSNDFFAQFSNCLTYSNKEEFVGLLYYALTHSPEPLSEQESFTLSWEAATKRLEAAGSIPVKEAELMNEALQANEAGIEIALPSILDNEEDRELIAKGLRRSRNRFRQFRTRLSQEIEQSNVLPSRVKDRLTSELGKRLDLDIDEIMESPKLMLQLSPAEVDKRLLEIYESVAGGPGGDLLRVIAGGNDVAFQQMYIKRKEAKKRKSGRLGRSVTFGPFDGDVEQNVRTPSQWVQRSLRRNLPKKTIPVNPKKEETKTKMCYPTSSLPKAYSACSSVKSGFCPPRASSKFTLLI